MSEKSLESEEEFEDPLNLAAGWKMVREREIEAQVRRAWAEGFKAGGEEEAKRRMAAKMRELNPAIDEPPAEESDAS